MDIIKKSRIPVRKLWEYQAYIFPLSFVFQPLLRFAFFHLGLGFEDNSIRTLGLMIGFSLFALFCGLVWLSLLRENKFSYRMFMLWGAVLFFFVVCFCIGFGKFGLHPDLLRYASGFISMALPAFFAGCYGGLHQGESTFFSSVESISILAFPSALLYTNSMLFNHPGWNFGYLGAMGYMTVAYAFMPFLLAHIIGLVDQSEWIVPFWRKPICHQKLLRVLFIGIYWVGIIATGTRGAYICVTGFCLLLVISKIIHREKTLKRTLGVSAALILLLLFNMFVYAPAGLHRVGRVNIFINSLLQQGQLQTSTEAKMNSEEITTLIGKDGGQNVVNPPQTTPTTPPDSENTDPEPGDADSTNKKGVGDRGTLFQLALGEFQKSPLWGMGPGGYSVKYGMYPHTACLELLCETGLVGTFILMSLLLYAIFQMVHCGVSSPDIRNLFLFFAVYAIQANISGSIWLCSPLLCALGYGLTLPSRHFLK